MKDLIKVVLAVLVVTLIRGIFGLNNFQSGIDDSNIYFVYVKNLANGQGFVYNTGGPRVEGFTSLLWTLVLTLIYILSFLPFETSILVLCFLITTATVFGFFRYVKEQYTETHAWFMALYILLVPGFIDWNVFTLMDLCLWIMATSWSVILLLRGKYSKTFYFLTILLPLIRPEGMAVALIIVFLKAVKDYSVSRSISRSIRNNFVFLISVVAVIALLTIFRLTYFGYPFPNTFYAKVSMSVSSNIRMAFFYLYDAIRHTTVVPFILLLISFVYMIWKKSFLQWRVNINLLILTLVILFFIGYPFLTGGDHFKYSRFFQPVFPLIGLLFMMVLGRKLNLKRPVSIGIAVLALCLLNLNSTDATSFSNNWSHAARGYVKGSSIDLLSRSQLQSEFDIARNGKNLAAYINGIMDSCAVLPTYGVIAAGGIGYVYKGTTIDLMGLNNPEMAHADKVKTKGVKNHGSFNKKVFYNQQVDIFLTWPDPLTDSLVQDDQAAMAFLEKLEDPAYFINRICGGIFNDTTFRSQYSFRKISNGRSHFYGFVKPEAFTRKYPCLQAGNISQDGR